LELEALVSEHLGRRVKARRVGLRTGENKHGPAGPGVEDKFNELMLESESTATGKSKFRIFGI
jgi:hypothetical protein